MIYEAELKEGVLLSDAMEAITKIGSFVYADNKVYIYSKKNLLKSKKMSALLNHMVNLDYDACAKLNNNMVRQFCLDKLYQDSIKEIEDSPQGQETILEFLNFLNKVEEIKKKGAIEVAEEESGNSGSANEIVCEEDS